MQRYGLGARFYDVRPANGWCTGLCGIAALDLWPKRCPSNDRVGSCRSGRAARRRPGLGGVDGRAGRGRVIGLRSGECIAMAAAFIRSSRFSLA